MLKCMLYLDVEQHEGGYTVQLGMKDEWFVLGAGADMYSAMSDAVHKVTHVKFAKSQEHRFTDKG